MRPDRVVLIPPHLNQDLSFFQSVEDFPIQQFVSHPPIERFNISVFPGAARFDEQRLDLQIGQPYNYLNNEEYTNRYLYSNGYDNDSNLKKSLPYYAIEKISGQVNIGMRFV